MAPFVAHLWRFVKIPAILLTVPDLSIVAIRKWHRINRETIGNVKLQYNFPLF